MAAALVDNFLNRNNLASSIVLISILSKQHVMNELNAEYTQAKGSFRLVACGCKSAADCGKDVYFLLQMVAFLQGDRKFPISALTQPTADARGKSSNVNEP